MVYNSIAEQQTAVKQRGNRMAKVTICIFDLPDTEETVNGQRIGKIDFKVVFEPKLTPDKQDLEMTAAQTYALELLAEQDINIPVNEILDMSAYPDAKTRRKDWVPLPAEQKLLEKTPKYKHRHRHSVRGEQGDKK
jgi:hypothetical protein